MARMILIFALGASLAHAKPSQAQLTHQRHIQQAQARNAAIYSAIVQAQLAAQQAAEAAEQARQAQQAAEQARQQEQAKIQEQTTRTTAIVSTEGRVDDLANRPNLTEDARRAQEVGMEMLHKLQEEQAAEKAERDALEKERATVEKDRAALASERADLSRQKTEAPSDRTDQMADASPFAGAAAARPAGVMSDDFAAVPGSESPRAELRRAMASCRGNADCETSTMMRYLGM